MILFSCVDRFRFVVACSGSLIPFFNENVHFVSAI